MGEVSIIGLDLAKSVFQAHVAEADGSVVFRRKLRRGQVLAFLADQPRCVVAMEACASAHHRGRQIERPGHEVRLIAPAYVKPFVKRQKNDMADAEAIAEAASRPTMRFVAVKSAEKQAAGLTFKARDLLVRQRTPVISALRGHLAAYGLIAPQGAAHLARLKAALEEAGHELPGAVVEIGAELLSQIAALEERIDGPSARLRADARRDGMARRLMTVPGAGPVCAVALAALAPPVESFSTGRDFAAWIGLVPRQNAKGGKARIGRTSKMGQRDLRRLLIIGATSVVRWRARYGAPAGSWLARMLATRPKMLVAVALADKIARVARALMRGDRVYAAPATA